MILHIRYTARQGVDPTKVKAALDDLFAPEALPQLALLFSLRHDFPTEWAAFVNGAAANRPFTATIRKDYLPYFVQGKTIRIEGLDLYDGQDVTKHHTVGDQVVWDTATTALSNNRAFTVTAAPDTPGPGQVLTPTASTEVFLVIRYGFE